MGSQWTHQERELVDYIADLLQMETKFVALGHCVHLWYISWAVYLTLALKDNYGFY